MRCAGSRTPTSVTSAGAARRALLDDVEHVAAGHHGEVRALARAVDELREQRPAEPGERLLPRVAAAELERRDAESPAPLVGQVHDEAVLLERREQVVGARARDAERRRDGARGDRTALAREEGQDAQRLVGRGHLRPWPVARRECLGSQTQDATDRLPRASPRVWNRPMTTVSPPSAPTGAAVHDRRRRAAPLRPEDVVAVARHGARVELDAAAMERVAASRTLVEALARDPEPHYGISTGFGALATTFIAEDRRAQLQASLIRSHAAGTGAEVETEVVRALQLLRLQTLATGHTGVRPVVVETYAGDAQRRASRRSCASTARSAAPATSRRSRTSRSRRWGSRSVRGRRRAVEARSPAAEALAAAGIEPLVLREKEGLALINGTDGMLGMLLLALHDLSMLLDTADVAAAMSIESQLGTDAVFAADLMALRPQVGQAASAANLRAFLADSPIVASHRDPAVCTRVQDAYSLRCSPAGARRRPRHRGLRRHDRLARARERRRQPGHHRRRPRRVQRQLPRRARRLRARLPRDRGRRRRLDLRAPHRPRPRQDPQQRAAAVPRRRGRRRLRAS